MFCDVYGKAMADGESCTMSEVLVDGVSFPRIRRTAEVFELIAGGPRRGTAA